MYRGGPPGTSIAGVVVAALAAMNARGGEPTQSAGTFTDIAAACGLHFTHFTAGMGDYYFPEIMGPGCALLDYDGDGDLDVYLLQGNLLDRSRGYGAATFPPRVALPPRNRLFRNELIQADGRAGALRFTDVTDESGTGDMGYAQGVATGDYDNDGDVDLYVSNFGPNVLLRNNGDGTFTNVTKQAGVDDPRWTTSVAFLDYDNDGFLDLVVAAYLDYTVATNKPCLTAGYLDYCGPCPYPPLPERLYRNRGDGTFRDVTAEAGLDRAYGHGLGLGIADFDGNGWTDIYVANDADPNQLWMNDAGRFTDSGLLSGAAVNHAGVPEAGMGVAVGDYDDDGDADIFVTHLIGETNTLYENLGDGFFIDRTVRSRLGLSSRRMTGFGAAWVDVDHDADLDLFVVYGAVDRLETLPDDPYPYHQRDQLLVQNGDATFADASAGAGPALEQSDVGRGLAAGDVDNDGDIDLLLANNNGPARLLRNELVDSSNWIILRVIDATAGRDAVGACVKVRLGDGRVLTRYVTTAGSYCSASDPRVHVAWPRGVRLKAIEVVLPGGRVETVGVPPRWTISTIYVNEAGASP